MNASKVTQQQFLSLFLRSERENFRYVAVPVPNLSEVDGNGHDPTHWRNNLYHFAQKFFKQHQP